MILFDTSVWVDQLRKSEKHIELLLEQEQVIVHPFVIGELALGSMPRYDLVIRSLCELPQASVADTTEVLALIKRYSLMGSGIGYVDSHLMASAKLTPGGRLLTRDKRLARVAAAIGIGYEP